MNRSSASICALVLALAAATAVVAADDAVPLSVRNGYVFVPVEINRRVDALFFLDTGAGRVYLDSAFADSANLEATRLYPRPRIFRDFTTYIRHRVRLEELTIDDHRFTNVDITLVRTDTVVFGERIRPPGVIGYPLLRDFFVTIDGPGQNMRLDERKPRFLDQVAKPIAFHDYWQMIIVPVSVGTSGRLSMIVDYGSPDSYLVPAAARRFGLTSGPDSLVTLSDVRLLPDIPGVDIPVRILPEKEYRGANRRANFDGVLGISYLSQHKITIDYGNKILYLYRE
jgi:hypothetical protein